MVQKIFKPKGWLIGAGAIHAIMGIGVQTVMPEDVAKMGWGDAVAAHDVFYETLMAFFIIPHVAVMFAAAFMLSGIHQARITAVLGGSMLVNFVAAAIHAGSASYMAEMGSAEAFAPPIILFLGVTLSGVLNWNNDG